VLRLRLALFAFCSIMAAGGRMEHLRLVGRIISVAVGWCMSVNGVVLALA